MNKEHEDRDEDLQDLNEDSLEQSDNQDVLAVLKKMQQQLGFLEKKIDQLLGQSSGNDGGRSFRGGRDRNFSKPFRPSFHRGGDRDRQGRGGDRRNRDFRGGFGQDRPRSSEGGFGRDRGGFGGQKKPFRRRREE